MDSDQEASDDEGFNGIDEQYQTRNLELEQGLLKKKTRIVYLHRQNSQTYAAITQVMYNSR